MEIWLARSTARAPVRSASRCDAVGDGVRQADDFVADPAAVPEARDADVKRETQEPQLSSRTAR